MARASDHFRQSDVTFWAIVALVTAGIAVVSANASAVLPNSFISALHTPRANSTSVEGLRDQVSNLQHSLTRINQEQLALQSRSQQQEKTEKDMVRRVSALEVTVPRLVESRNTQSVDLTNVTASVNGAPASVERAAAGGTVSVRQTPLPGALPAMGTEPQALPEPLSTTNTSAPANPIPYGVAIGGFVSPEGAESAWKDLQIKIGPHLLGFSPVLSTPTEQGNRLLIGPMETLAEARQMCERLERIAFSCLPVSYEGRQLIAENAQ